MNHFYDEDRDTTRCREYGGELARAISANGRVSCPDCFGALTDQELADEWHLWEDA